MSKLKKCSALVRLSYDELYELGMTLDSELGIFFGNLSNKLEKMVEEDNEKEEKQRGNQNCEVGVNCD
tara:strand:- start:219 stop:422 length:204 start_codon:yes stop_codon:yes gene_type:complete